MRQGFTLIQISILLIVASLVLVNVLPSTRAGLNANNATTSKMNDVLTALRAYEAANARLPCPADASLPIGSTRYGVAAANPGATTNCTGGSPAANYTDATNDVAIGMVPVRALGLSNDYATDAYGRDITYAVDTNATVCFSGTLAGKITVTDNGTANSTIAALVSHGADGHGAWIPLTGSTGTAVRLNTAATDANELLNAHVDSSFVPTTTLTNFVRTSPTSSFDDLLTYKSPFWTLNTAPLSTVALIPSVTPPSSGSYYTGQTFSFTVTWGNTIAVTGTPRLALTIPQQAGGNATHYAPFVSASGNAATFTYTVQSTDYAPSSPSSVAIAQSSVDLNGGTITEGGATACLNFTAPSLTGVLLNPLSVYTLDTGNYRIQKFTNTGTYVTSMGAGYNGTAGTVNTQGTGPGQLDTPDGLAVDSSGNVWVGDYNGIAPVRLEKFNSSGVYQSQLTLASTGCVSALTIDSSNNFWVSDTCNSPNVEKYSSSGTLLLKFAVPYGVNGVVIDGLGDIWVTEGIQIQEYNSSGTSVLQTITGLNNTGGPTIDAAGDIWVANPNDPSKPILEYNCAGTLVNTYAPGGSAWPWGLASDTNSNIWMANGPTTTFQEYNNSFTLLNTYGSSGTGTGQFGSNSPAAIALTSVPPGVGACVASITPPTSGSYSTGQPLTFTVTYNTAVTVTGTPRLVLTIGSNTRYANYVSGSGTTTLTFTYTIVVGDSATSIAIASSIDLNSGTITSGGVNAGLSYPPPSMGGIAINITSFMLVAAGNQNAVMKFDLLGNFISQFPCPSGTCSPSATNGQLSNPFSTAVDGSGNIWVVDNVNNRVSKFSSSYSYITSIGAGYNGVAGSPGGSGTANGQFSNGGMLGMSIDGSGNIWVADSGNNRFQEFNSSGTYIGQLGTTGSSACSANLFNGPQYIHFDSTGNIYAQDYACGQVEEFNSSGTYIKTFGPTITSYGSLSLGDLDDFDFDSCGNIWWQDEGHAYLLETDYAGNYLRQVSNTEEQQLSIDSTGKVYSISESGTAGNITVYNSIGGSPSTIASGYFTHGFGLTIVGSAPTRLALSGCSAVILSNTGPTINTNYATGTPLSVTITYDQAVTVTGTPEIALTIGANTRQATYASGTGTATLTFSYTPVAADYATSITIASSINLNSGTISSNSIASGLNFTPPAVTGITVNLPTINYWIADTASHSIRTVTASTGNITKVAGTEGTSGHAGDGAAATAATMNSPAGLAVDTSGNVYVADTSNHTIREVTVANGHIVLFAGTENSANSTGDGAAATSAHLHSPNGVAVDASGNVYIADTSNDTIREVTVANGHIIAFAGTEGSAGHTHDNDGSAATAALLNLPKGVAVDNATPANVYIADTSNDIILKVTGATGHIAIIAGTEGTAGHAGDGAAATSATLNAPTGVAVDTSGNVFIADAGNHTIREVTVANGHIVLFAGTENSANSTGDGGAAASAHLHTPTGVAVDASGNVFIADTGNNKIRWVSAATGNINTLVGNGTAGYTGDAGAAASAETDAPKGVAVETPLAR